jgi:hypothetical protein
MSSIRIFIYVLVIGQQKDNSSLLQVLCVECEDCSHSCGTHKHTLKHTHTHMSGRELHNVVLPSELDEPCDTDSECVANNSRCGYVCRCRVNYIQNRQKDKCLKGNQNPEKS